MPQEWPDAVAFWPRTLSALDLLRGSIRAYNGAPTHTLEIP